MPVYKTSIKIILFFLRLMLAVVFFSTLSGVLSPAYWFFDLFNHFRLQILLTSVVLVGLSGVFHKKCLTISILLCFMNIVLFCLPFYNYESVPPLDNSKQHATTKIISANVLYSNSDYTKALRIIKEKNPDIITLIEPTQKCTDIFDTLKTTYLFIHKRLKDNNFSLAIYSKIPFEKIDFPDIGDFNSTIGYVEFKNFNLILVHPIPPLMSSAFNDNKNYMSIIAKTVQNMDKPVIVTGDFNATHWSESTKILYNSGLRRITPLYGVAYTWPAGFPFLAVQIDHFFAKGIKQADFSVLSDIGSDHYPIEAVIDY